ncbi:putative transcription factor WD40-like family [Rosa chinensis]|uniref:Putative transcription factor WD40-like family n=1 Tax=Rosa chinensis TaxID=74649 RepID=A0A2P6PLP2_ROSCH|nr:putative transcription factor WD40-like family [Rosa chinensis]
MLTKSKCTRSQEKAKSRSQEFDQSSYYSLPLDIAPPVQRHLQHQPPFQPLPPDAAIYPLPSEAHLPTRRPKPLRLSPLLHLPTVGAINFQTLKIWRDSNLRCVESVKAHEDAVSAVAVAKDGTVYTGSANRRSRVWGRPQDEKRHVLVATLEKHKSAVILRVSLWP